MTDTINVGKNVLHHGSDTAGQCVSGTAVLGDCELTAVQVNRNYTTATKNIFLPAICKEVCSPVSSHQQTPYLDFPLPATP